MINYDMLLRFQKNKYKSILKSNRTDCDFGHTAKTKRSVTFYITPQIRSDLYMS